MNDKSELELESARQDQLTARALAAAGLVESAESDARLVYPLPADAIIREIVASYDSRSWGETKVRCAVCAKHQKHFKGFRVALESGEHARIGIDCGEKRFGKDTWKAISSDFRRRIEIETLKARVEPTVDALRLVTPLIEEWHQRTNRFAKWLGCMSRELPALAAQLKAIAKQRNGRLEIERFVWREGVSRDGRPTKYREAEAQVIGQIPYPGTFLGDTPTHGLNGATASLREAVAMLSGNPTGMALANAFRAIQRARVYIVEADRANAGALANLRYEWLADLCDWANRHDSLDGEYRVSRGVLILNEQRNDLTFEWMDRAQLGQSNLDVIVAAWPGS